MYFSYKRSSLPIRGFGLIELMVSITIITLVSALVITKHNAFNSAVLLRNQAYEVAFAVRQAQLLAVSGSNPNTTFVQQYGIYFTNSSTTTYLIFRDNDADGNYDTTDTQIGPLGTLDKRFFIRDIFYNGTQAVPQTGTNNNLSITFRRPNFDALFERTTGGSVSGPAYIDISRVGVSGIGVEDVRRIEVTAAGQIAITEYP